MDNYGITSTQDRAKESVFWPGITRDVESKVKDCIICQENAASYTKEIMQPHEVPRGPWIKLGMDLFEHNKRQYLLIVDYFSKFPFIRKLHSLSTGTVINELKEIIPEVVISDGGPQFRSEFRTLHKSGDSSISNPHHPTTSLMEKQKDLLELSKTPLRRHIRVAKTQTWHYYATDLHQSTLNCHHQQN